MDDLLTIGGVQLTSRLFLGSGKYSSNALIPAIVQASAAQVITVAVRRVDLGAGRENILSHVPRSCLLMPNTSGARDAREAVRIARLARKRRMEAAFSVIPRDRATSGILSPERSMRCRISR